MMGEALAYSSSCRSFLQNRPNVVFIDASQDFKFQIAQAEAAILSAMAKKTARLLPFEGSQDVSAEVTTPFLGREFSK
jgi:hypothetical protein